MEQDAEKHTEKRGWSTDLSGCRQSLCQDVELLSVGAIFMLFSVAHWANQSVVNRFTYLHTLHSLQQEPANHTGHNGSHTISEDTGVKCQANLTEPERQMLDVAQVHTTRLLLLLSVATEIPAIFVVAVLGVYSDIMGRRKLFILSAVGQFINNLTTTLASALGWDPRVLFFGSVVYGLAGGFGAVRLACYIYAVDLAKSGIHRTAALAFLQALMGMAGVVMHVAIGVLIETFEMKYTSFGSLLPPIIICTVACCRLLRETVVTRVEDEDTSASDQCWIFQTVAKWLRRVVNKLSYFYFRRFARENTRSRYLLGLLCFCCLSFPAKARFRLLFMYEVNSPLCWLPSMIGKYRAFSEGCRHFLGYVFIRLLQHLPCCDDEVLGLLGIASHAASDALTAVLGTTTHGMFEGALFATLSMVESAVGILGQWGLFTQYQNTVDVLRGSTIFFTMAGTSLAAFISLCVFRRQSQGLHSQTVMVMRIGEDALTQEHPATAQQNDPSTQREGTERSGDTGVTLLGRDPE